MAENVDVGLAEAIKLAGWWQGSILPESAFGGKQPTGLEDGWWVITSQTCNLYNADFDKIPVFEMVAARKIPDMDRAVSKGNNPRILHVKALGKNENSCFEIDIQNRAWVNRRQLVELGAPAYEICDAHRESNDWVNNQWLDNFAGWISRSYTRVTLPDDFNDILHLSKIQSVLTSKLRSDSLYGIYLSISSAANEEWIGTLGLMPAPYFLEIMLVTDEDADPTPFVKGLKTQLFENKAKFTFDEREMELPRAEAAKRLGLMISPSGVTGKNIAETSLLEVKSMIRFTLNDFLSRAGSEPE
ncbi:hypothetical protein D3C81_1338440 [compost metagenome]